MSSMEKTVKYPDISIPEINSLFKEIDKCIIENRINYLDNENEVRKNSNYNMDDYFDKKNIYESNIVTKFKEQFIDKCIKSNHGKKNEISFDVENQINFIFKDYVFYYLSKPNYNYKNENIISFFEVLFKLFISENNTIPNNEKKLTLNNLAIFSLYIESYKEYIYLLTKFVYHMDYYIDGFLDTLNKLINEEAFEIEYNDKNLKYSAVCCILSIKNYRELSDDIFDALMKEIKLFQLNLERINNELLLMLKQIFYLNDLVLVYDYLMKNGMKLKDNLMIYNDILIREDKKYTLNNNSSNDNIINEEFEFLSSIFSKSKDYSKLIVKLVLNKLKISDNKKYREKILSILCSNNSFIINSKIIFESVLKNYELYPVNKVNDCQWNHDKNYNNLYYMDESDDNNNDEYDNIALRILKN